MRAKRYFDLMLNAIVQIQNPIDFPFPVKQLAFPVTLARATGKFYPAKPWFTGQPEA
jgi:hypothetical protein